MWVSHPGTLTIVIPVVPEREQVLDEELQAGGKKGAPLYEALASLETIHFARWVLLPSDGEFGPLLAFESNHDGSQEAHLDELVRALAGELDGLLAHCVGYALSDASPHTAETRKAFLTRHVVTEVFPYRGHPNLSAKLIKNDLQLKRSLSAFVDEQRRLGKLSDKPEEVRDAIKRHAETLELDIQPNPRRLLSVAGFYGTVALLALVIAAIGTVVLTFALGLQGWAIVVAAIASLAGLGVLVLGIYLDFKGFVGGIEDRERETSEEARKKVMREADRRMPTIFYEEDRQTQNALTHLVPVKPDKQRQFVLSVMLLAVKVLAATLYVQGKLGPIDSIHCARWIKIDGGKRLLFFSNYDGSWESYLGEFVDKLAFWLTAVWSSTEGFPTTKNMFESGAEDEEWFKRWTRSHQLYTHVWYAAYPNLSVQNVIANARLREGLSKNLTDQELRAWLRLL